MNRNTGIIPFIYVIVLMILLCCPITMGFRNHQYRIFAPQTKAFMPYQNAKNSFKTIEINRDLSKLYSSTIDNLQNSSVTDVSNKSPYPLGKAQVVYLYLTSIFVTCLLIADIIGVKIFEINLPFPIFGFKSIEHTCGMLTFPLTFMLSDLINEYYGPEATKRTVYIGLWMSVLVCFVVSLAQWMPFLQKPFNVTPHAFNTIFGSAKSLYIASLGAYLVGQLTDIWLFSLIKKWTKGKYLWLRASVSTIVSQLLDSFLVSFVAFRLGKQLTNQIPATIQEVLSISITGYGLKFVVAGLVTPLLYALRDLMSKKFKLEPVPP